MPAFKKVLFLFSSEAQKENIKLELLKLDIPLNETGSAGLGVSLKARAIVRPDGSRQDCGIFVKKVCFFAIGFVVNGNLFRVVITGRRGKQKMRSSS